MPDNVREVAGGLVYRDFITVGLLVKRLKVRETDRERRPADQRQLDLHPGTRREAGPPSDLQQLESLHGCRSNDNVDRARIFLLRVGRPVEAPDAEMIEFGKDGVGSDRHHRHRRCSRRHGAPYAENLSGLFRHLRPFPGNLRVSSISSPICFWSGRNGMQSTTTKIIQC